MSFISFARAPRTRWLACSQTRRLWVIGWALVFLMTTFVGCGGKPFNVKQRADLLFTANAARAEASGVQVRAEVLRNEDLLLETFDANLILAGVLPVRVALINQGQEPVDLRRAGFELRGADGRSFKTADAKRAFKRLISYYEISTYSKSGYKKSQEDFAAYVLDLRKPLSAGESRQGLIFFIASDRASQTGNLTLVARGLDAKQSKGGVVELKLE